MFQVVADYPATAVAGGDFLTRCSKGAIDEIDPHTGDPVRRDERVLLTGRYVEFEGDVCFGEKTVRHMAHQFGMVDAWRVQRLQVAHEEVVLELTECSTELARVRAENAALRASLDKGASESLYVALDGSTHASKRAATEHSRAHLGQPRLGTESLRPISADEAPLDVLEPVS